MPDPWELNQPLYRDPSGVLWVQADPGWSPGYTKVLWVKPVGAALTVTGKRLDGAAPPLEQVLPENPGQYLAGNVEPTYLVFPTAGCWEVRAHAAASELRFVVAVRR